MTFEESKRELSRKLNISYEDIRAGTDDLFKWADLDSWVNVACLEAWDYAKWIFKEKAYTTTTVASQDYYDYPNDFVSDSIFLLRVADSSANMKTYKKIRYLDFIKYREDSSTGKEKYWADHRRFYFINPKAFDDAVSRSIEIWGLIRFTELAASTTAMPFSPDTEGNENSGNHAIVKLAYAMALASEKKKEQVKAERMRAEAYQMFESLAKSERESQVDYEVVGRPFFKYTPLFGYTGKRPRRVHGTDDGWSY